MSNLLIALNYYSPYVSGLTNVARDVAEGLVKRGWRVTVLTSQHLPNLPLEEIINGVHVYRSPILFRLGKGVVSFQFLRMFRQLSAGVDVVNLHAPMLEAGLLAKLSLAPVVTTYQCDVSLPNSLLGTIQNKILDFSTKLAATNSRYITVTSDDYANNSRVADALTNNRRVIPATCHVRAVGLPRFRDGDGVHVGFLGRIVEEKGIEYLVEGFRALQDPKARLLIGGDFSAIAGGSVIDRVRKRIGQDARIKLLGFVPDEQIVDFYSSLDIFALPSVNPFEAFGIVQVEAMMMGIPVIASDLPGVRQPVLVTGMGKIVPVRSEKSITTAILEIALDCREMEAKAEMARELYSLNSTLNKFESVFVEAKKIA